MTYWAREHEHNLRRIGDIMRELEYAYEDIIPALINDLKEDGVYEEIKVSVSYLVETKSLVNQAMTMLANAKRGLPEPQFRPTVHPTAADVMERDA
jgi:hypothetical protein